MSPSPLKRGPNDFGIRLKDIGLIRLAAATSGVYD